MTQCAIISDIHGNLAAFEAVLKDIESVGVKEIWCLGDIVGYGPQPVECVRLAEEKCSIIIQGNHERALQPGMAERFNKRARAAIEWTAGTIAAAEDGSAMIERLTTRPKSFERKDILFVHGSPNEPTEEYLMPRDAKNPAKMDPQWLKMKRFSFCGHTHFPGVFEEGEEFVRPDDMLMNVYMLDYQGQVKAIINVGSVGQPRDGNPQACYVTFDGDSVVYRRVAYNANITQKLIYDIPSLDNFLGDRLVNGK